MHQIRPQPAQQPPDGPQADRLGPGIHAAARQRQGMVDKTQRLDLGHRRPVHGRHLDVVARLPRGDRQRQPVRQEKGRVVDDEQQASRAHGQRHGGRRFTRRPRPPGRRPGAGSGPRLPRRIIRRQPPPDGFVSFRHGLQAVALRHRSPRRLGPLRPLRVPDGRDGLFDRVGQSGRILGRRHPAVMLHDVGRVAHVGDGAGHPRRHGFGDDIGKPFGLAGEHMHVQRPHECGHIITPPQEDQVIQQAVMPRELDHLGIVPRHPQADQHAAQAGMAPDHQADGGEEVGMVFLGIPAGDAAQQDGVLIQAPLRAPRVPIRRIRMPDGEVVAVGNHQHAVIPVPPAAVHLGRAPRTRHDHSRQPARHSGAQPGRHPRGPADLGQTHAGIADSPGHGADPGQARDQPAQQVGVIHPGLHHIRAALAQDPIQPPQAAHRPRDTLHVQGQHLDAILAQRGAHHALTAHGDHDMAHMGPWRGHQAPQHRFGAAVQQAGNDMHDLQARGVSGSRPVLPGRVGAGHITLIVHFGLHPLPRRHPTHAKSFPGHTAPARWPRLRGPSVRVRKPSPA
ncbi:hypothetical protein CDEF62S_00001 [Castellaniella defragrans]